MESQIALLISGILYVLSIVAFFVKNGTDRLTLKQIIGRGAYTPGRPWYHRDYPNVILIFSVVLLIIASPLHPLVTFVAALSLYFVQKLIIRVVLAVISSRRL